MIAVEEMRVRRACVVAGVLDTGCVCATGGDEMGLGISAII